MPVSKERQKELSRKHYLANKDVVRAKAKKWSANQRLVLRDVVLQHKRKGCSDCEGHFHLAAMEFDHVTGNKKFNISDAVSRGNISIDTLQEELDKCEVVCANCHRIRTFGDESSIVV